MADLTGTMRVPFLQQVSGLNTIFNCHNSIQIFVYLIQIVFMTCSQVCKATNISELTLKCS